MGVPKTFLTNEQLGKRFVNSFELVNHAIELGKIMIRSGRPCRVSTAVQNTAYQLLLEILAEKDSLDRNQAEEEAAASQIQVSIPKHENHYRNPILVSVKEQLEAEDDEEEDDVDEEDLDLEIDSEIE